MCSRFGAIDVIVRVSIGGDPFTVNEVYYSYYANTKAVKCIAFGPGLISTRKVAGQMHSFMLQAKDFNGKRRTTGLDPVSLKLENKSGSSCPSLTTVSPGYLLTANRVVFAGLEVSEDSIVIEDLMDGRYKISYAVPSAGDWTMTVSVDENAYAVSASDHPSVPAPCAYCVYSNYRRSTSIILRTVSLCNCPSFRRGLRRSVPDSLPRSNPTRAFIHLSRTRTRYPRT